MGTQSDIPNRAESSTRFRELFQRIQGFLYALISSISAELVLSGFVEKTSPYASIGRITVLFLTLYTIHRFSLSALTSYKKSARDIITLTILVVGFTCLVWVGRILGLSISTYATKEIVSPASVYYALPYASGGLLLNVILGNHYALVFAVSFSLIVGLYTPDEPILFPYVLVTTLLGSLSLSRVRSRGAFIRAGISVMVLGFAFSLASLIINPHVVASDVLVRIAGSVVAGVLCVFTAAGVCPVLEYLGGYVTDIRLIEMATLDHPLLKELSVQAPGTWNHSMVMGMMSEAAADAVGANPVIARVGSYFHDVGKMKKPIYFSENQQGGENRHDKLSPSMSALIIRAHVKEGVELARKHHLPSILIDMITQHHGTSLIEYFHDKAVKEAEGTGVEVDASLYQYPGPKPQTREAGILMLADGIEAAARTLADPSVDRIQGLVQKKINKIFASGQLDECELTLKDLHKIAKCFVRVLAGIYHQRAHYFEPAEKVHVKTDESQKEKHTQEEGSTTKAAAKTEEDLKRLGMEENTGMDRTHH